MKFMRKSKVEKAEALPGGVAVLTISTGDSMAYEAGQYIWLALPGLKCTEYLPSFSFHPYSISSAYVAGDKTYTVHVKSMGEGTWSDAVVKATAADGVAAFAGGCRVGGPCGHWAIQPVHLDRIVLVAGGVGITPMASLLADIRRTPGRYPLLKSVTLVWAIPNAGCASWFADLLADAASDPMFDLQVFVTRGGADAEKSAAIPLKSGRPDVAVILAAVASAKGAEGPVGLFACGPEPMLDASRSAVAAQNASASSPSQRAVIHTEVFSY